jgi:hypothetical protein
MSCEEVRVESSPATEEMRGGLAPGAEILSHETERYKVSFRFNQRLARNELALQSKTAGKHRAVYTHYDALDEAGDLIGKKPITKGVAEFIIRNFEQRGDAESFRIYVDDLRSGRLGQRGAITRTPEDVRHVTTSTERSFTATGDKLDHHWPIFQKYKETGYGSIIRATMTLHQVCASHCHFCSTISRNKRDSISLREAQDFVTALLHDQAEFNRRRFPEYNQRYRDLTGSDIRLRGLILSGGGQPNLWPHFEAFVNWLSEQKIDLGLITNGFPKAIPESVYEKFKWIRISITPDDASPFYPQGRFDRQYIPATIRHRQDITVGYSYVYGPWTTDDVLTRINEALDENGFDYCRTLADCNLTRNSQLSAHRELAERLRGLGFVDDAGRPLGRIFHQLKYHGTQEQADDIWQDGQCFLQSYNVFWDTTGHEDAGESFCYPCDSVTVLAEEATGGDVSASERKFNAAKWGTVSNRNVRALYEQKVRPFFNPRENCSACLFMRNNEVVRNLRDRQSYDDIRPKPDLLHVNFP